MNESRANVILFPTHRRKAALRKREKSKRARGKQSSTGERARRHQ